MQTIEASVRDYARPAIRASRAIAELIHMLPLCDEGAVNEIIDALENFSEYQLEPEQHVIRKGVSNTLREFIAEMKS